VPTGQVLVSCPEAANAAKSKVLKIQCPRCTTNRDTFQRVREFSSFGL
jgi:hypothetical protein